MLCRKYLFQWPALLDSPVQGLVRDSKFSRPVALAERHAIVREHLRCAGILALFLSCAPFAVARFVVSIVIRKSIDGCFWKRLWSHVFKEGSKRFSPPVTNRNSTAAVILVMRVVCVVASVMHRTPNAMFWCGGKSVFRGRFTSARNGVSVAEGRTSNDSCLSALTAAEPPKASAIRISELDDRQSVVDVSAFVFRAAKQFGRITGSHDVSFRAKGGCGKGRLEATTSGRLVSC